MKIQEIYSKLFNFISERFLYKENITDFTRLEDDVSLYGDEAAEFLYEYSINFDVDISDFDYDKYFTSEKSIYSEKKTGLSKESITVKDLKKGILTGYLNEETINADISLSSAQSIYDKLYMMRKSDPDTELINYISRYTQIKTTEIYDNLSLADKPPYLSGWDASNFMKLYSEKFSVDIGDLHLNLYFSDDSFLEHIWEKIFPSSQHKKQLTVKDLKKGIASGKLTDDMID
jgi:hypothetical protein